MNNELKLTSKLQIQQLIHQRNILNIKYNNDRIILKLLKVQKDKQEAPVAAESSSCVLNDGKTCVINYVSYLFPFIISVFSVCVRVSVCVSVCLVCVLISSDWTLPAVSSLRPC